MGGIWEPSGGKGAQKWRFSIVGVAKTQKHIDFCVEGFKFIKQITIWPMIIAERGWHSINWPMILDGKGSSSWRNVSTLLSVLKVTFTVCRTVEQNSEIINFHEGKVTKTYWNSTSETHKSMIIKFIPHTRLTSFLPGEANSCNQKLRLSNKLFNLS